MDAATSSCLLSYFRKRTLTSTGLFDFPCSSADLASHAVDICIVWMRYTWLNRGEMLLPSRLTSFPKGKCNFKFEEIEINIVRLNFWPEVFQIEDLFLQFLSNWLSNSLPSSYLARSFSMWSCIDLPLTSPAETWLAISGDDDIGDGPTKCLRKHLILRSSSVHPSVSLLF